MRYLVFWSIGPIHGVHQTNKFPLGSTSSAVWVAFVVLLFVLPANSLFECHRKNRLLTWKVLNETMPWHLLFLASTCVVLSKLFRVSSGWREIFLKVSVPST